jgi:hypothetical protein
MSCQPPRGDRVVAGHYQAMPDPVSDQLTTLVLNLAAEVWTLRDRTRLLQTLLEERGHLDREHFDTRRDDTDQLTVAAEDRDAFVARLMRSVVDPHRWAHQQHAQHHQHEQQHQQHQQHQQRKADAGV